MSASLRGLRQRVEGVAVPPVDVSALVTSGERRLRRRRLVITTGSAATVLALVLGVVSLTNGTPRSLDPVNDPPTPAPTPTLDNPDPVRPLSYAVGQTIHYGDRVVDTGQKIVDVDITDAGVVYLTRGGELWFTDGSRKRQLDPGTGSFNEGYEAKSAAAGSRVAWVRYDDGVPVELVVYDVATDEEVLTEPAGPAVWPDFDTTFQPNGQALLLTKDQVVVQYSDDNYGSRDVGRVRYVSYDLATGRRTEVDDLESIEVSPPTRALTYRLRRGDADNRLPRETDIYRIRDGLLIIEVFDDNGVHVADPVNPVTGDRLGIPAPAELPERAKLRLFQWLDDGVFALAQINRRNYPVGALVVCTVSEPGCEVAEAGPARWILPGREAHE